MAEIAYTRRLRRAVTATAVAFAFFAGTASVKPAVAALVGVGIPGDYYGPAPACAYYYPYGCYGYPAFAHGGFGGGRR